MGGLVRMYVAWVGRAPAFQSNLFDFGKKIYFLLVFELFGTLIVRRIPGAFRRGVDHVSTMSSFPDIVKSIFNWPINQSTNVMKFLNLVLLHVVL